METKKLVEEKSRIQVLGKKVCIVTQTFGVIVHTMRINSINIKEKKRIIEQIWAKNTTSILYLKIK